MFIGVPTGPGFVNRGPAQLGGCGMIPEMASVRAGRLPVRVGGSVGGGRGGFAL